MGTEKEIIVALEFGSSAIRGIAGRQVDGTLEVLDIEYEKTGNDTILRGIIFNIDKTTLAINNIISRMNQKLGTRIVRAYVSISGQSLHTASNFISRNLEATVKITPELVDKLMDNNRATQYPDSTILEAIAQEYYTAGRTVSDPVGIQSDQIEGRFMNVVARNVLKANLERCMKMAGIDIVELLISPLMLANTLLTENEKRSGCALVDFGAATTTVSVYTGNLLRHLVVIPLGGDAITSDIANSQSIEKEEAETLKRRHGVAYVPADSDAPHNYPISNDRMLNENDLQNIIGARQEEIILNVLDQLENTRDKLLSGVIITGGAAQLKNMVDAVKHHTKMERVKMAKSLITTAKVDSSVVTPQGININTLLAMLAEANQDCTDEMATEPEPSGPDPEEFHIDPSEGDSEATVEETTPQSTVVKKKNFLSSWFEKLKESLEEKFPEE